MKIESLVLQHLRMPLVAPFETSFGRIEERDCILVSLRSNGIEGYGECVADRVPGYSYETSGTAWHILREFIAPVIVGRELRDAAEYQGRVAAIRGHHLAKAGVEMALWDLVGKAAGRSLGDLLGGERRAVPVGVSVGIQVSPDALVQTVRSYVDAGYRRVKVKIKPGRDVEDVRAVRREFPALKLQVDANSAYTGTTAEALLPLDDLDLLLIEQPLAEDDLWDHSKLQQRLRTAICLDESIVSARHARQAIDMKACRIINIKAARLSGLREAVAVHDICREQGLPVWCGGMLETGVGRASNLALASLPNFLLPGDISASERYYARDITVERFRLNADSTIDVPTGPGLGIHLDPEAVKAFCLNEQTFTRL